MSTSYPMLTVLTEPTPMYNPSGAWRNINRALPARLRKWAARLRARPLAGHQAVTRSLLDGLRQAGVRHNYNPPLQHCIAEYCVVLSNAEALRQALALKRQGRIRRLLAGPNLFTVPTEMEGLLASPEVDVCLVPSDWVGTLYAQLTPALQGRIQCWPAGVDMASWTPSPKPAGHTRATLLLYVKNGMPEEQLLDLRQRLAQRDIDVIRLDYGSYDAAAFRQALSQADLCVFISGSESQGIALQEAWASDKATWVFNPGQWGAPDGQHYPASSAPYLTPACGHSFVDLTGLESLADQWNNGQLHYQPRAWVEQHMSDAASTRHLLNILFKE